MPRNHHKPSLFATILRRSPLRAFTHPLTALFASFAPKVRGGYLSLRLWRARNTAQCRRSLCMRLRGMHCQVRMVALVGFRKLLPLRFAFNSSFVCGLHFCERFRGYFAPTSLRLGFRALLAPSCRSLRIQGDVKPNIGVERAKCIKIVLLACCQHLGVARLQHLNSKCIFPVLRPCPLQQNTMVPTCAQARQMQHPTLADVLRATNIDLASRDACNLIDAGAARKWYTGHIDLLSEIDRAPGRLQRRGGFALFKQYITNGGLPQQDAI